MAIRYSSSGGTPFGDTANRPSSPQVGQTYYNGQLGYLEIYTVSGWIPATGANDFSLNITGTNTTVTFSQTYSSGSYSIVSFLNDATLDVYAYASDGSLAGYSNTKAFTATQRFNKMVILGGSYGDVLQFSYKTTYATSTSTTDVTAGPYITSITPSGMPNKNDTITITGGNFATDVTVAFTGTGYSSTPAKSIVRSSSTSLIVTRPDNFPSSGAPYTVTVTNPSVTNQPTGSAVHQYSPITAGVVPVWVTSSSQSITTAQAYSLTLLATDADGASTITYSNVSGTLPSGITFNSSTGIISGTTNTTGTFTYTVRATDSGGNISDLIITFVSAYTVVTGGTLTSDATYYYRTFTGNGTLGLTSSLPCDYLIVAGGGSGGSRHGGGGGGGGVLYGSTTLSSGNKSILIGAGGAGPAGNTQGNNGVDSSAFGLTSVGGGRGAQYENSGNGVAASTGGSGGGGAAGQVTSNIAGGNTTGQGYAGGNGLTSNPPICSGGGGGAGGVGVTASGTTAGNGGPGYLSNINGTSLYYAGGGGGATYYSNEVSGNGGLGGGGGGATNQGTIGVGGTGGLNNGSAGGKDGGGGTNAPGGNAGINTGSGGGGAAQNTSGSTNTGGSGGSGIVIVRYTKAIVGG